MISKWQMLRNALILSSGAPYPWGAGVLNGNKLYLFVSYHLYFIPGGRGLTFWHAIELDRGYQQKTPFERVRTLNLGDIGQPVQLIRLAAGAVCIDLYERGVLAI